ncbi:protein TIFY 9 [Prunus dulcis]|uniref:protein TIFY 9 n=1 Tax=Prunus dulcis TaxID=3755 RepID=UPI0014834942|nr:protein TIFY 9 [Prunus dulcis]
MNPVPLLRPLSLSPSYLEKNPLPPCHSSRSSNLPNIPPNKQFSKQFASMSRATVELDFFGMDQHRDPSSPSKSQFQKFLHRQRSFRGIQNAMYKIKPQVLKSVIASGSVLLNHHQHGSETPMTSRKSFSVPSSPKAEQIPFPSLPVYIPTGTSVSPFMPAPAAAAAASEKLEETTTPLTIFYNGTVSVFDVPRDKAESLLKLALEGNSAKAAESALAVDSKLALHSSDQQQLLDPLDGDLPIARRKSLQRFLEKRKERLNSVSPFASHA